MVKLTHDLLRLCFIERFQYTRETEKAAYTQRIQAEQDDLMKECKEAFMDRLEERRVITDILPIPIEYIEDARTLIQRAIRTRQLDDLEERC